ncbi:MAG: permease, partial [Bdellovibrionota bacterium]
MNVLPMVAQSLLAALEMFWSILWALVLGFALSGIIMAFVPKKRISALLGKAGPRELAWAMLLGAASSSCSYAAAAMAHSLFRKGAHIISAFAFLIASTNLVLELSLVLWLLMGWQFVVAEFVGGVLVVAIMAILMRLLPFQSFFLREEDEGGAPEKLHDPRTLEGWKAAARAFVSEWKMIGKDVAIGCVVSGALMTLVPTHVWQALFLSSSSGGMAKAIENAFVGPLVSVLSFVCSVGNIPLAAALYHGGIGFGGAVSFIYADLIIIPLLLVY